MKSLKEGWALILMISSLVLLLVLQALWLRSSYNNEFDALKKETNSIFRSTILAMQDSLIVRNIQPAGGDSIVRQVISNGNQIQLLTTRTSRDTLQSKSFKPDGSPSSMTIRDSTSQIQIFVAGAGGGDSIQRVLRPIVSEFRRTQRPGNFVFRFNSDTLNVADIERSYTDTLRKAGIALTAKVQGITGPVPALEDSTHNFTTDFFYLPHTPVYVASFGDVRPMILYKISPQIAFVIVLTLLTTGAFYSMYRNLRSQHKLVALKNDLISNITHELKTPVATVSVALEALKNFQALDNPKLAQEYLEIAQRELERLSLMTDKILKTSAFDENGIDLKLEPIQVDKIVSHVLSSFKLVLEKHQAKVEFQKAGTNFTINGNSDHFTNVVYNLLDNAVKYSLPGCSILIKLIEEGDRISLSIKDDGIGIPEEYREKVFEKFFRVPTGDVHDAKGYGLGLSYVSSVVKSHNGSITLHSTVGEGSTFTITLPLVEASKSE